MEALLSGVAFEEKKRRITRGTTHMECEIVKRHYAHEGGLGHADYVRNVIIEAAQMDDGILVSSTPDGPMLQTKLLGFVEMELHELLSTNMFPEDKILIVQGSFSFICEDVITVLGYDAIATGRGVHEIINPRKEVELLEFERYKKILVSIWVGNLNFGLAWQYYAATYVLENFKLDNLHLNSCLKRGSMQSWYGIIFKLDPWGRT